MVGQFEILSDVGLITFAGRYAPINDIRSQFSEADSVGSDTGQMNFCVDVYEG